MKKTHQPADTTTKSKTLRVRPETIRKLGDPELEKVQGGVYEYRSLQSSCC